MGGALLRENSILDAALEAIECLPVMEELGERPTLEELSKAIDGLPTGKTLGLEGFPPEVIKCAKGVLMNHLHEILCQC